MIGAIVPWFLGLLMFGMGLGLTPEDFYRIARFPKSVAVGLGGQLLLLPLCGFSLAALLPIRPDFAVGLCLLTLCPGGALSNMFTYLGRGDVALSVSMTAVSSLVTVITIPIGLNMALGLFMDAGGTTISLPMGRTALQILLITVIPVSAGMVVLNYFPRVAKRAEGWVRTGNLLFLPLIIAGILGAEGGQWFNNLVAAGALTVVFNLFTILLGYGLGLLFGQAAVTIKTLAIEVGAQNAMLGVAIAASPSMLGDPAVAIVPSIYAVTMVVLLAIYVALVNRGMLIPTKRY